MNVLVTIISVMMEFFCIYVAGKSFTQKSLLPSKRELFFFLIIILSGSLIPGSLGIVLLITGQLLYFLYFLFCYPGSFPEPLFLFILSFGSMILSQYVVILFIGIFSIDTSLWYLPLLGNFLSTFLLLLLFRYTPVHKLYSLVMDSAFPLRCILLNTYLVFISFLLLGKINAKNFYNRNSFLFTLLILLAAANVCVIYYEQRVNLQQKELLSYQKNLPIYETLIHDIRANQHEYANHIQTLRSLPSSCPDYDSLCKALSGYSQDYSSPQKAYPLLTLNMPLLAASLYNLCSQAEKNGISMLFNITSPHLKTSVSEHQLTDFICILTQNAIEASQKGDTVYALLSSANGRTRFEIRNISRTFYTSQQINQFFQKGFTTKSLKSKKDGIPHGYGLYHLLKHIEQLHGDIGADCIEFEKNYWMIFFIVI